MTLTINPKSTLLNIDNWQVELSKPASERTGYMHDEHQCVYQQVCALVKGKMLSTDEYIEMLYSLNEIPSIHILHDELDKMNDPLRFQSVQRIVNLALDPKGLSVNRCTAFVDGEKLIPGRENSDVYRHLLASFKTLLEIFVANHDAGLADTHFRRILIDTTKWCWSYLAKWLKDCDFPARIPKVIWYGDFNKSEAYFLVYLMLVGCDVVILHPSYKGFEPQSAALFEQLEKGNLMRSNLKILKYQSQATEAIDFPTEEPIRKTTLAFLAEQEMKVILHADDSSIYRPWQFRNYLTTSVTLKTTYDEAFLIAKEKAFVRPNFSVKGKIVQVPNLFTKVMGESNDRKQALKNDKILTETRFVHEIRRFPFTTEDRSSNNLKTHYQKLLSSDGSIDPDKLMQSNLWRHVVLPNGLQKALAAAISRCCHRPMLKQRPNESVEDIQLYLFREALSFPERPFVTMLQQFDFSQDIPKIILRTTVKSGTLSRSDAAFLLLLNEFGFDIFVFNRYGRNDVEIHIRDELFDTHWLENIATPEDETEEKGVKKFLNKMIRGD